MNIQSCVKYERNVLLEDENSNLVIIDVILENSSRQIINIYRNFNPVGLTARDQFIKQCRLVRAAFNSATIFLGDFNLDYRKKHDVNYSNASLFAIFDEGFDDLNLLQLVNFCTWSRLVGNTARSSILDHIYVNDVELVKEITHITPVFGDHELVMAVLCIARPQPKITLRGDWQRYSQALLNSWLGGVDCARY